MRAYRIGAVAAAILMLSAGKVSVSAQSAKPEPTLRDSLVASWVEISDKIVAMAEDFPEEKYGYQATKDVRTFADNLRHVAFWNRYVTAQMKGEKIDPRINELPKAEYGTKAKIVAALKSSLDEATAALKAQPATPPNKVVGLYNTFTEHSGEHYGQLVVYYRLNGLVPPASRPKKK